jgi:antitoxin HicB
MHKHAISIKWSDEDNSFVATIPGIEGLSALGETREEALSELHIAAGACFEALEEAGKSVPPPKKATHCSGQLRLRMPKSLHSALSCEAEEENVSLNTYIVTLLSERHVENKLLNTLAALVNSVDMTNSKEFSPVDSTVQTASKIEESQKKYSSKKRIK